MKLKNVVIGKWYRISEKNHPAFDRIGKVSVDDHGQMKITFGHFNQTIYNIHSGMIKES